VHGHVAARQTTPKAFGAKSVLIRGPFKRLVFVKKIFVQCWWVSTRISALGDRTTLLPERKDKRDAETLKGN